jgi:hypothetical protein
MGSQFFFGAFADWRAARGFSGRAQWDPAFAVYGAALLAAALGWALYVSRPVIQDEGRAPKEGTDDGRATSQEGIKRMEEGLWGRKATGRGDDAARDA